MNEYKLKTQDGEIINKVISPSLDEAITFFAKRKRMTKSNLCEIFLIEM